MEQNNLSKLDAARITELGKPGHPEGEAGFLMLSRMADSHREVTAWGLSFGHFSDKDVVMDVGCGSGMAIHNLVSCVPGIRAFGVDYSEVSTSLSRKNNADFIESGSVSILDASVDNLPFEDNYFSKVFTVESFYFWPDHLAGLKEIRRVLMPGGKLFVIADIYDCPELTDKEKENVKKYNLFNPTPEDFKSLFDKAGFCDVKIHTKEETTWICIEGLASKK